MNAENKVEQLTEDQMAYQQLGRHLLATVERNHPECINDEVKAKASSTLDQLLLAFCTADADGSVCINIDGLNVSDDDLTLLEDIGLLVKAHPKLQDEPSKRIPFIWDCHVLQ